MKNLALVLALLLTHSSAGFAAEELKLPPMRCSRILNSIEKLQRRRQLSVEQLDRNPLPNEDVFLSLQQVGVLPELGVYDRVTFVNAVNLHRDAYDLLAAFQTYAQRVLALPAREKKARLTESHAFCVYVVQRILELPLESWQSDYGFRRLLKFYRKVLLEPKLMDEPTLLARFVNPLNSRTLSEMAFSDRARLEAEANARILNELVVTKPPVYPREILMPALIAARDGYDLP